MDSIKIIVTSSDTTSITPANTHYQLAPNVTDSQYTQDICHNAQNNNIPKSKRWNLPPLKLSSSEQNTFTQKHDRHEQNIEDDGKKPLLSPLLSKSFLASQSTTSLNSGKKVKILPSASSSRISSNVTGTKMLHKFFF